MYENISDEDMRVGTFIKAPWDEATVEALNRFQTFGTFHPFTCPESPHDEDPKQELVATSAGWMCPNEQCDYTQDWAIAVMVNIASWCEPE